ncbi:MAG TPA: hypothetical protein VNA68_01985, partial [Candidatus Dormibacteraeota bacterium]|nr:hypothetical protein [Candidatus Dormibacteraeota bacterium]
MNLTHPKIYLGILSAAALAIVLLFLTRGFLTIEATSASPQPITVVIKNSSGKEVKKIKAFSGQKHKALLAIGEYEV